MPSAGAASDADRFASELREHRARFDAAVAAYQAAAGEFSDLQAVYERFVIGYLTTRLGNERGAPTPELHALVAGFAAALKERGMPPEKMLVALKGAVSRALEEGASRHQLDALHESLMAWAIDGYYEAA